MVPDTITPGYTAYVRIEDPLDTSVNDTSNAGFKIRGSFSVDSPQAGDRWVVAESNHSINWTTTGTVVNVSLYYYKDNNLSALVPIALNLTNDGSYAWPAIPDDVNSSVRVMVRDSGDADIYAVSGAFTINYYNISWMLRDFLSALPIAGGLVVQDSSGWTQTGLSSSTPIVHPTRYGSWSAEWSHESYGNVTRNYIADGDNNYTLYLESKIVHVWEAQTEYVFTPETAHLDFKSTLMRDGSMAGFRDPDTGIFSTIASNASIEIYNRNGTLIWSNYTDTVSEAGFFSLEWNSSTIDPMTTYNGITEINTNLGGKFRTPFLLNPVTAQSLYNVVQETWNQTLVMLGPNMTTTEAIAQGGVIGIMTTKMNEQASLIETKMNQTVEIMQETAVNMTNMVNDTLTSFETRTFAAIEQLQAGANQTLNASEQATEAAEFLQATAKKYSWSASVAPDPALTGDEITLTVQGYPGTLPLLNIYSWKNDVIIGDVFLVESATEGLYSYTFTADNRFDVGKAYTYIVSESVVTSGLVSGSGVVESMSMTTIAGLASAAPEAERAAKKALDAIKAVEAAITSEDNINIALTLKNLKESVEELPEALGAGEKTAGEVSTALNELADRLKAMGVEEGFDFNELLEKALSDSPAMKDVRSKTEAVKSVVEILLQIFEARFGGVDSPIVSTALLPGSVRFRVIAVNPSKTKTQMVQVKTYLPQEVRPRDVMELSGLELEYDEAKNIYYVYRDNVELIPSEVRAFEIEVEDIWFVPQETLNDLRDRTSGIAERLKGTEYAQKADEIARDIYTRLDEITASQADENVSRSQHIGIYRDNLETIARIKEDIAKMEKILAVAGGPLSPEMLSKTKIKAESPTKTMTWIVIFIIVVFAAFLGGVLFFTWLHQSRVTREELLNAKQNAFPDEQEKKEEEREEGK